MYFPDYTKPNVEPSSTRCCAFCGQWHIGMCSRIKTIEYNLNGSIKTREFFKDNEVSKTIEDFIH